MTYYLRYTCLSRSFGLTRCCTLAWVTKIMMRAISNVHAGRRSSTLTSGVGGKQIRIVKRQDNQMR